MSMNRFIAGGALGAAAMYFFDPHEGRRRRARTFDKAVHARKRLNAAVEVAMRDTTQRAAGLRTVLRRRRAGESVPDEVLAGRVRAALGRVVSHPHALAVRAQNGQVTLEGPVLAREVPQLLRCVRAVAGVRGVEDRLARHEQAGNVSALQGGVLREGGRFELLQENWSPAARLLVGAFGTGLAAASTQRRGAMPALLGLSGLALALRAAANRSFASLLGLSDVAHGIVVQKTIRVQAPVERVFAFWSDYQNFPRCTRNIRDVRVEGNRSRWTVAGPAGLSVEWRSELVERVPNRLLRWRATPDSTVQHEGLVRFEENGHGGTRVSIELRYVPPGGAVGHAVASLFGADPKSEMDADLMRMKTTIETGHAPHDAARSAPARTEDRPELRQVRSS